MFRTFQESHREIRALARPLDSLEKGSLPSFKTKLGVVVFPFRNNLTIREIPALLNNLFERNYAVNKYPGSRSFAAAASPTSKFIEAEFVA